MMRDKSADAVNVTIIASEATVPRDPNTSI